MARHKAVVVLMAITMAVALLGACGPTPEPQVIIQTVPVEVTKIIEKEGEKVTVIETQVVEVEKVVTPTPEAEVAAAHLAPDPTTLTYVMTDDAATLDPHLAYEGTSYEIIESVIEGLIWYNKERADDFVPMLALEVPSVANGGVSADGLTYTFNIRPGVKFHDGGDLTASDVAYSWERVLLQSDPNSGAWMMLEAIMGFTSGDVTEKIAEGAYAGDQTQLIANATPEELKAVCEEVKSRFEVDDAAGTFKVTLAQPWGPFLAIIARPWAYVIDQQWTAAQGDWDGSCDTWQNFYAPGQEATKLAKVINGTGPYILDHWTPDVEWVLTANENYWRQEGDPPWPDGPSGVAKIKRVVHKTVPEWGTRFAMFQTGEVGAADVPTANRAQADAWVGEICDYQTYQCTPTANPDAPLRLWPGLPSTGRTDLFISHNVKTGESGSNPYIGSGQLDGNGIPPDFFSDIHVRKAFSYCFDYDTYIAEGQNGEGTRNNGVIIVNMLGYNPDQEMYPFDLDKCKEELALAWDGKLPEVGFRLQGVTATGYTMNQTALAILQSNLRSIEPKYQLEIVTLPWAAYLASFRAGLLPIAVSGWSEDYHDPHNWVQPYLIGTYTTRQSIPEELKDVFRPLVEQAVVEPDPAKRAELYYEIAKLRHEWVPQVVLSQAGNFQYESRWVKGFFYNPAATQWSYFYGFDLAGRE